MEAVQVLSDYELERGKPMPSRNHGLVQVYLGAAFLRYEEKYSILSELALEFAGKQYTPDICVYPKLPIDWQHDEVKMTDPPLLTVEIVSPKQGTDDLIRKADIYFEAGVKSCWIVQPALEAIAILQPGEKLRLYSHGDVEDPATKIKLNIREIFR